MYAIKIFMLIYKGILTPVILLVRFSYCCKATEYTPVEIPCDGYSIEVLFVSSCGCGSCSRPNIVYSARAQGLNGEGVL